MMFIPQIFVKKFVKEISSRGQFQNFASSHYSKSGQNTLADYYTIGETKFSLP